LWPEGSAERYLLSAHRSKGWRDRIKIKIIKNKIKLQSESTFTSLVTNPDLLHLTTFCVLNYFGN